MVTDSAGTVLDASALLTYLHGESGSEVVEAALIGRALISVVNYCEVLSRLADSGSDAATSDRRLRERQIVGEVVHTVEMTAEDALVAADLRADTRRLGLSLGDRVCLALAIRLGLPVLTADRAWGQAAVGVVVQVIR